MKISSVCPAHAISIYFKVNPEFKENSKKYEEMGMEMAAKRIRMLEKLRRINLVYLPLMALIFVAIFWIVGLKNAELL